MFQIARLRACQYSMKVTVYQQNYMVRLCLLRARFVGAGRASVLGAAIIQVMYSKGIVSRAPYHRKAASTLNRYSAMMPCPIPKIRHSTTSTRDFLNNGTTRPMLFRLLNVENAKLRDADESFQVDLTAGMRVEVIFCQASRSQHVGHRTWEREVGVFACITSAGCLDVFRKG